MTCKAVLLNLYAAGKLHLDMQAAPKGMVLHLHHCLPVLSTQATCIQRGGVRQMHAQLNTQAMDVTTGQRQDAIVLHKVHRMHCSTA